MVSQDLTKDKAKQKATTHKANLKRNEKTKHMLVCVSKSHLLPRHWAANKFFLEHWSLKELFFFFCYKGAQPQVCIYSFILSSQISIEQSELITYRIKKKKKYGMNETRGASRCEQEEQIMEN